MADSCSPEGEEFSVRAAITAATQRLTPTSDTPRLDAELLAAHALGLSREAMLLNHLDASIDNDAVEALVARRMTGEPISYILGRREFWSLDLAVGPGVLVPRPDSETLIEAAVDHFAPTPGPATILDLGTGSGALLLAALAQWPQATGLGIDRSPAALEWARRNGERTAMSGRAQWRSGDWAEGIADPFDLVLCNPPYVEADADLPRDVRDFEPHDALFAGADGLDDYRRLAPMIADLLSPIGIACIEIGPDQAGAVTALLADESLKTQCRQDLVGRDRCLIAQN